jgi:hypothetical protein
MNVPPTSRGANTRHQGVRLIDTAFYGPANRLRHGYGGPPKRYAKAEAGPHVLG